MWNNVQPLPFDKYRNTIFNNKNNLKNQNHTFKQKRHTDKIVDNTSFNFYFNNKNDRSIVAAPTRKTNIEKMIYQNSDTNKQRNTIFSTPTMLKEANNFKNLESKKHYKNQFESDSMKYVWNQNNYNLRRNNSTKNYLKNVSSVGNPILWNKFTLPEKKIQLKNKGRFYKDIHKVTANFLHNETNTPIENKYNKKILNWDQKISNFEKTNVFRKKKYIESKIK